MSRAVEGHGAESWSSSLEALQRAALARGELDAFVAALSAALDEAQRALASAGEAPTARSAPPMQFDMVGNSPAMKKVFGLLAKIVHSDVSVLIQGETGTGKELVARALHHFGPRKHKPFLAENCAAVPAELLESELFGHKRGSFTGAVADRDGHFVAANGGTVFLDEIGDMPLAMQAKLLRVLQEGEVRPVGSNKTIKVDVRVVAATNRDLRAMCAAGTFREDLYFRLNVITIQLPPLRERTGDVEHLVRFVQQRLETEMGRSIVIEASALEALEKWKWPGNVRELENEIRRAAALSRGAIRREDLSPQLRGA